MKALRQRMIDDMAVRRMSERTLEAYLAAVTALARYSRRSPDAITNEDVQAYLLYLIRDRKRAWSTCNIAVSAFRFLYHVTLKRDRTAFSIPAGRQPSTLPEILSREEVQRIIAATRTGKHRALVLTAYATGLRANELVHLTLTDLDAARGAIRVEQGKGAKDRYTILSPCLLEELRGDWTAHRPRVWLFPTRDGQHPMDTSTVGKAYVEAKQHAGIPSQTLCDALPRLARHTTPARTPRKSPHHTPAQPYNPHSPAAQPRGSVQPGFIRTDDHGGCHPAYVPCRIKLYSLDRPCTKRQVG